MSPQRFVAGFGGLLLFGYLAFVGVCLAIDPFNLIHQTSPGRYTTASHDFAKRGISLDRQYDSFLMGTSLSGLFKVKRLNQAFGAKFADLLLHGSHAAEQVALLGSLPRRRYRFLVAEVYFNSFAADHPRQRRAGFPYYFYNQYRWDDFLAYMRPSAFLLKELRKAFMFNYKGRDIRGLIKPQHHGGNDWEKYKGKWQARAAKRQARRVLEQPPVSLGFDLALLRRFLSLASRRFERVYLYLPPISAVALKKRLVLDDPKNLARYIKFKRDLVRICIQDPKITLVDYQTVNRITSNYEYYWDYVHFRSAVHAMILRDFASLESKGRLAPGSVGRLAGPGYSLKGQAAALKAFKVVDFFKDRYPGLGPAAPAAPAAPDGR